MRQPLKHRSGFTLIEVIVAIGIFFLVAIAFLRFSITSYQWSSNLVIRSMAQNLAELSAEQIAGLSTTNINGLMTSSVSSPNFPVNGTTWANDMSGFTMVSEPAGIYYIKVPGEFLVTGITTFFPTTSSEIDPVTSDGDVAKLDARSDFTKTKGMNDLHQSFGFGGWLFDVPVDGTYQTSLYSAVTNVVVEPTKHSNDIWDSSLILYRGEFPRFLREVTIKKLFSGSLPADPTQVRYSYQVNILWEFAGQKQMISVSGERTGDY